MATRKFTLIGSPDPDAKETQPLSPQEVERRIQEATNNQARPKDETDQQERAKSAKLTRSLKLKKVAVSREKYEEIMSGEGPAIVDDAAGHDNDLGDFGEQTDERTVEEIVREYSDEMEDYTPDKTEE